MPDQTEDFEAAFSEAMAKPNTDDGAQGGQAEPIQAEATPAPAPAAAAPAPAPTGEQPAGTKPEDSVSIEELKRQLAEARHHERSSSQRISAFARENSHLKSLVDDLNERVNQLAAAAKPAAAAPPQADEKDVLAEAPDLDAAVAKRVAAAVEPLQKKLTEAEQRLASVDKTAAEARQAVEPISRKVQQETFEATWAELDKRFTPQWREDRQSEGFTKWIDAQPEAIKGLYQSAVTPDECAKVLNLFYLETGKRPAPAAEQPAPAAANPQHERLRLAAGLPNRTATARGPQGPAEDDFDGNFGLAVKALRQA